jgi:hypothetical protein
VRGFIYGLSFAFISAMLLVSGLGHATRFARFRSTLRDHGIVPHAHSGLIAAFVTGVELLTGAIVASVLILPAAMPPHDAAAAPPYVAVTIASAALGIAFLMYLRRVLRQPPRALSCGCSFLSGQLTPASLAPAGSLLIVSLLAFATTLVAGQAAFFRAGEGSSAVLSIGWGATLAVLVLVLPAAVAPRVESEGAA